MEESELDVSLCMATAAAGGIAPTALPFFFNYSMRQGLSSSSFGCAAAEPSSFFLSFFLVPLLPSPSPPYQAYLSPFRVCSAP
jgi:hypothetical protein